jgi:hypothetical protein
VSVPLLTSPRNLKTEKGRNKRFYTWRQRNFWSVTTVIDNAVPKRALLYWGIKKVAEGAADLAETLPTLVAHDREAAVRMLKGLPWAESERAADLGSLVHAGVEAYALGKPMPEPPALARPRMLAFQRFLAEHEPHYYAAEAAVFNRERTYAGTLDAIADIGGRRYLLDVKTGKGVYPEVAMQLAAYRFAEFLALPDGTEYPMPAVDAAAVLHLPADGSYELIEVSADQDAFAFFLYAQQVFAWLEEGSKSVLLGPLRPSGALAEATAPLANLLGETPPPSSQNAQGVPF